MTDQSANLLRCLSLLWRSELYACDTISSKIRPKYYKVGISVLTASVWVYH